MEKDYFSRLLLSMYDYKIGRKFIEKKLDSEIYKGTVGLNDGTLESVKMKKYEWGVTLLRQVFTNIEKKYISSSSVKRLIEVFIEGVFHGDKEGYQKQQEIYKAKYGIEPPSFLVISPTQKCNLRCTGCYACSDSSTVPHLSYEVFIFFIISGTRPEDVLSS